MGLQPRQRRRIVQVLGPVLAAALVAYFAYYTVEGERGLIALTRLQAQAAENEATLAQLQSDRQALELKVRSMRPDSLDLDRLDEQARRRLNDTRSDEVIIDLRAKPKAAN